MIPLILGAAALATGAFGAVKARYPNSCNACGKLLESVYTQVV
ncbi:hypothetical protein [Nostoc sp.]